MTLSTILTLISHVRRIHTSNVIIIANECTITVIRNSALIICFEIYSLDNFMSLPSDIRPIKRRTKEKPQRTPVSSKKRPEGRDEKGESGGQKYSFLRSLSSNTPGELGDREALRSVFSLRRLEVVLTNS